MNRRLLILIAASAALRAGDPTPPTAAPGARFAAGRVERWTVRWDTEATTRLPVGDAPPLPVRSHLEAELVLATSQITDAAVTQLMTLRRVDAAQVFAGDDALPLDPRSLEGVVARITSDLRGELLDVDVPADAPPAARNTLVGLARALTVESPGDGRRAAAFGEARDRWDGATRRVTEGWTRINGAPAGADLTGDGAATITWGPGGRLLGVDATERGEARIDGATRLTARDALVARWEADGGDPPAWRPAPAAQTARAPADRRAAGLETPALLTAVRDYAPGTPTSDLMWRGTARVDVDPAARQGLVAAATDPDAGRARQELALDLLAHARSPEAHQALREALDRLDPATPALPDLLQRLSFVRPARPEDAAFLIARLDAPGAVGHAAHAALGAVAGHLRADGAPEAADAALAHLRAAASAPDPLRRAAAIAGLGNAADQADEPALIAATRAGDPRVRAAATHALRAAPVDEALRPLLADASPVVQRAALSRLVERSERPDAAALGAAITAGAVHGSNLGVAASVLADHADTTDGRAALTALLAHPDADPPLRARVRAILDSAAGGAR